MVNEIEIIKLNNDRMNNIKALNSTNTNTSKLKNEINLLKKEKEFLGQKNDELQKRINSLDQNKKRNKSVSSKSSYNNSNSKSKVLTKTKPKQFKNLSILKNKGFTINKNNNNITNSSKSSSKNKNTKKFTPKKTKFLKVSIVNKVVNICIKKNFLSVSLVNTWN